MTIARDKTGAVVGQVVYADVWAHNLPAVYLFTKDGYVTVPRSSVRLEEISDR